MKILFTGASSFTGYWFVKYLAESGHEVLATFTKSGVDQYDGLHAQRVGQIVDFCTPIWNCSFGDDSFLKAIQQNQDLELVCHHGAYVTDYKSLDFDVVRAVGANSHNVKNVLPQLVDGNCKNVLLTGSVFEQDEGMGEMPRRAFSPYGLSKGLTAETFEFWCQHFDIRLSKFVIPNPFGAFEEKRFTAYLINNWLDGKTPGVNTPDYVRDNIHIALLAKAYVRFAEETAAGSDRLRLNPCGYIESQGSFAQRLAAEMRPRLDRSCDLELANQVDFSEPRIRVNFDKPYMQTIEWDEAGAWDDMADYYLGSYGR